MNKPKITNNNLQKKLDELNKLTNEISNLYKQKKKLTSKIKEFYATYLMMQQITVMKTAKQTQQLNNNIKIVLEILASKGKNIKEQKNANKSNGQKENSIKHLVSETLIVKDGKLKMITPTTNTERLKAEQKNLLEKKKTLNTVLYGNTKQKLKQNVSYENGILQKSKWKS